MYLSYLGFLVSEMFFYIILFEKMETAKQKSVNDIIGISAA